MDPAAVKKAVQKSGGKLLTVEDHYAHVSYSLITKKVMFKLQLEIRALLFWRIVTVFQLLNRFPAQNQGSFGVFDQKSNLLKTTKIIFKGWSSLRRIRGCM